ncbi:hypothetical protein Enr8_49240 [Blastopirellula retiformator]|uniref:Uncharacterized protein n=1 Tax=Blastopirellula retiformator TaxID=2527970 RepID=A0A5C5UU04_9BACT|nr:hypothetical protein Enr8_49240 [Blastopirellula retiformator]
MRSDSEILSKPLTCKNLKVELMRFELTTSALRMELEIEEASYFWEFFAAYWFQDVHEMYHFHLVSCINSCTPLTCQ